MAKLTQEKKKQIATVAVAGALALVGIWFFGIRTLQEKQAQLLAKITETQNKEHEARKLVQQAPQRQAELDESLRRLEELETRMVSGDTNNWIRTVMNQFRAAGNHTAVEISTFSNAEEFQIGMLPDFPYKSALYRLNGQAFYHDIGRFIADFENAFPHIRVQNIDLQPIDASQSAVPERLSFTMEIVALIKPPPGSR